MRRILIETVKIVGYLCWAIGVVFLISALLQGFAIRDLIYLFSFGIAAFGIGTGFIGLSVAGKSGERMKAMATLEFYEKIAVIESYIQCVAESYIPPSEDSKKAFANRIYNDIKGAKQLKGYVHSKIDGELNKKVDELKHKADNKDSQNYKELIDKLIELQQEEGTSKVKPATQ